MKLRKYLSAVFAVMAAALILATAVGYVCFHKAPPMIGMPVEEADLKAEQLMDAICRGDYAAAGESLYGKPELGWNREAASQLGDQLWQAYSGTMSYEFSGHCYATGSGIFRDVTVIVLDIPALNPKIQERFEQLMEPHLVEARYDSEVFDENGALRQAFAADLLSQAVEQILQENAVFSCYQISLELIYQNGQWWVVPGDALIDIIAGAMTQ